MGFTLSPTKVVGHKVLDAGGNKIGQAGQLYMDHTDAHEQWVMVKGGLLGGRTHFAPMHGASMVAEDLRLAYDKSLIDSAPELDGSRQLSAEEELALYRHYGLGRTDGGGGMTATGASASSAAAMSLGGERLGSENGYLTRSEERLHVSKERLEAGHARLHKYVTTERIEKTVPVSHEEVRVVREMIVPGSPEAAAAVADWKAADQDVVLHAERTVVSKESVPVERVRMRIEEVTEDMTVTDEIRVEHIDFEGAEQAVATETWDRPAGAHRRDDKPA